MSDKLKKHNSEVPETVEERPWVTPRVDIFENDNELLLRADVPGVNKETLQIDLDQEQLNIVGRVDTGSTLGDLLGQEFQPVDYRRTFTIPTGIDVAKIAAELTNGVLHLHLPKAEEVKPRRIEIKAG